MRVLVYFLGVCTHIKRDPRHTPWLDVPHRVVLVEARKEKHVHKHPIPRHATAIIVNGKMIPIEGMTVSVVSRDQRVPQVDYDKSYGCIPQLLTYVPDLVASKQVVQDRDVSCADAYFDVDRGTLRGCRAGGSAAVELAIDVDDPEPILRLTPWSEHLMPIDYQLTSADPIVCVRHTADHHGESKDEKYHFLLHSGISGALCYFDVPDKISCEGQIEHCLPNSLGPGCSDSSYP